jgi:uncharacterized RDD family membrane protein YckC
MSRSSPVAASFDERFSAFQIDGLILAIPYLLAFFRFLYAADLDLPALLRLWALAWHVYFGGFWWLGNGQTPGMRVRHIQVVRREGGAPGLVRSLLRVAGLFFGYFFGIVQMSVILDRDGVGLHDRIARTRIVHSDLAKA